MLAQGVTRVQAMPPDSEKKPHGAARFKKSWKDRPVQERSWGRVRRWGRPQRSWRLGQESPGFRRAGAADR